MKKLLLFFVFYVLVPCYAMEEPFKIAIGCGSIRDVVWDTLQVCSMSENLMYNQELKKGFEELLIVAQQTNILDFTKLEQSILAKKKAELQQLVRKSESIDSFVEIKEKLAYFEELERENEQLKQQLEPKGKLLEQSHEIMQSQINELSQLSFEELERENEQLKQQLEQKGKLLEQSHEIMQSQINELSQLSFEDLERKRKELKSDFGQETKSLYEKPRIKLYCALFFGSGIIAGWGLHWWFNK